MTSVLSTVNFLSLSVEGVCIYIFALKKQIFSYIHQVGVFSSLFLFCDFRRD